MKACARCGMEYPESSDTWKCRICRECRRVAGRAYMRNNPDKCKVWREKRVSDKERYTRQYRNANHKSRYGITAEEADKMRESGCASCGRKDGKLCIDHDHITGKVRGVLCSGCNRALGFLQDSEKKILGLLNYIKTAT